MSSTPQEPALRLLSIEEYARLEESDGYGSELVEGVLVREPRPGVRHGQVQARLVLTIGNHIQREGLGGTVVSDVGVVIHGRPQTVRGPDVAYWADGRLPDPLPEGFAGVAPDLAVEIVSPSNTVSEMAEKVTEYLSEGTRMVWILDPRSRTAMIYRARDDIRILTADEPLDGSDVLPGLWIRLGDLLS